MDQELDMDLSDGEIIYVGKSDSEEEVESRYSIKRPDKKRQPTPICISDDEESITNHQMEGGALTIDGRTPTSARKSLTRCGTIKLDRKRDYWSSKANVVTINGST